MESICYLLGLQICGIKNIEKPIEIRFYKKTIENDFDPERYRVKAIFGENGSGKTAIVLAVQILKRALMDKNYLFDSDSQKILVESVNKHTKSGYIECEFIFCQQDDYEILKYKLEFVVKEDCRFYIAGESLQVKNGNYSKNIYKTVFSTQNGELIKFGNGKNEEHFSKISQNLLDQRSFISFIINNKSFGEFYNKDESILYAFVLLIFSSSLFVYLDEEDNHRNYFIKKKIDEFDTEEMTHESLEFIRQANEMLLNSFFDINIIPKNRFSAFQKHTNKLMHFIKIFKPELKGIDIERKEFPDYYKCDLILVYEHYRINQQLESRGIKKLIRLFDYLNAASKGAIVFIDELDSNINDVYLDKLIEFFMYYGRGQLCFTSHNLSPMAILNNNKCSISFISGINTMHSWTRNGNESPENAYRNGFIEDSPFNIDATDFIGILGGTNEQADSNVRGDE